MSDMTPAAEALDEDLHLLMHDAFFPTEAVKERVWGAKAGPPRTVEESRVLYRRPIVEAFQASGAETLAEFPERVVAILADRDDAHGHIERLGAANCALNAANDRLRHERDMAKAEADRYHTELTALRESEHAAKLTVKALRDELDPLRAELATTRKAHAEMTAAHAKAVAALSSGSLAEVEKSRQSLADRVAELLKENDELRRGIRRLCRILGKAMAGDL